MQKSFKNTTVVCSGMYSYVYFYKNNLLVIIFLLIMGLKKYLYSVQVDTPDISVKHLTDKKKKTRFVSCLTQNFIDLISVFFYLYESKYIADIDLA